MDVRSNPWIKSRRYVKAPRVFRRSGKYARTASTGRSGPIVRARPLPWSSMSFGRGPFPREFITTLSYGDVISLTGTTGAVGSYTFRANSLFDPDLTGTGHQPRYFDTLCGADNSTAPYQSYEVRAAKIKCTFSGTGTDNLGIQNQVVGIICRPGSVGTNYDRNELIERNDGKYKQMGYWSGNQGVVQVKMNQQIAPVLGFNRIEDVSGAAAAYNANPTNAACFDVVACAKDGSSTSTCNVIVEIDFLVKFYTMNDPADS